MSSFFITTPIYYVNARPHLGHAYTTIVADCMARFNRLMGRDTFFLTGTDEHGEKIVQAAEKNGQDPQTFVDGVSALFQGLLPMLNASNDAFVRTTDAKHKQIVQAVLQKVYDNGDIYFGEYGGHYCYGCERFYTEKELEDGLCPQHKTKPEYIAEKNYFFRMSKYQGWLKQYILDNPDFIRPERYKNEVLSLLESGALEDLCISRPKKRLSWGIELPFDSNFVCYVWFDALLNYISALDWPDSDNFKKYWPRAQHLVAKDILKPHAVFWPTMLKAAGMEPYRNLNVHGYWLVRDTKMSKSLGNVVDPLSMIGQYGVDSFRYYLMREMHFGSDASFTEESFITRLNADLANDLGNLMSRVLSMNAKYFDSVVPSLGLVTEIDQEVVNFACESIGRFQRLFDSVCFAAALESLWALVRSLNKYVDGAAPWTLYKNKDMERLGTVMHTLLNALYKVAIHIWPVMPQTAETMLKQLGMEHIIGTGLKGALSVNLAEELESWNNVRPGTKVAASSALFPRVELKSEANTVRPAKTNKKNAAKDASEAEKNSKKDNSKNTATQTEKGSIEFAEFQKLDLRVGTILEASQHPNADKLLCFKIDLGEDTPRQILSGVAQYFKPEELVGRQVVVVANLPPRTIRGLESQGMILTADKADGLELLSVASPVGAGAAIS